MIGPGGVPLGEDKLIRWKRIAVVQGQQEVKAREVASDLPDPTLTMHPEKTKLGAEAQVVPGSRGGSSWAELRSQLEKAASWLVHEALSKTCGRSILRRSLKRCFACCRTRMSRFETT